MTEGPYTEGQLPFQAGSETSKEAAESLGDARTARQKVYEYMQQQGQRGATDDEIEAALDMRHQTASARRRDLQLEGKVKPTEERRDTRSGRKATVWVVVHADQVRPTGEACRSCGAAVLWKRTMNGKWMPVDAEPATNGNLQLDGDTVKYVQAGTGTHVSHFATCPNAKKHRK